MPEKKNECSFCELIKELKERGAYFMNGCDDITQRSISKCRVTAVVESYALSSDCKLERRGTASYRSRPLNFCPECGRKINDSETTW